YIPEAVDRTFQDICLSEHEPQKPFGGITALFGVIGSKLSSWLKRGAGRSLWDHVFKGLHCGGE
ncbi:MAG: hypothetical protein ACREHG_08630, partial [Candidatus Saccharimonadales bacterium]